MLYEHQEIIELLEQVPLFAHLSDSRLDRLAGLLQRTVYQEGEIIFDVDSASEAMFIIYQGGVNLYTQKEATFASLEPGDAFGEEALLFDNARYYKAVSSKDAVLLRLSAEHYLFINDELPGVHERLEVAVHSRSLSTQVGLPWLQADEYIHVITRRHPAILYGRLILPMVYGLSMGILGILLQMRWAPGQPYGWIAFGIGLVSSIVWLVWNLIDWRNDYFIVTNKRVVWIEKVALIYDSRQEAPLRTIMSVGLERSRIGSIFGFSDVVVMTYVGTIRLRDIANAETIGSLIESYWNRAKSYNRKEEAEIMAEKLSQKLGLAANGEGERRPRQIRPAPIGQNEDYKEPGFLAWLFSDFIRLRYESSGSIVYRKHWFVLIKQIWAPVGLFVLAVFWLAGRLGGMLRFLPVNSAIALTFILMFVCIVWAIYQYADWRNDIFKVTLEQIIDIDRKPLGKVRRRSAPLENILSIEYERLGFWGFLLNFGTVYITVGNMRLSFDYVYNPSEVQQDIFYRMGERLETVRQFEIDSERERVSEWIASYHRAMRTEETDDTRKIVDD